MPAAAETGVSVENGSSVAIEEPPKMPLNKRGDRRGMHNAKKSFGFQLTDAQMKAIAAAGLPVPVASVPERIDPGPEPQEPLEWRGLPETVRGMKWVQSFGSEWDNDARRGYRKIWVDDPKGFVQLLTKLESDYSAVLLAREEAKARKEEGGMRVVHGDEHLMELLEGWHESRKG